MIVWVAPTTALTVKCGFPSFFWIRKLYLTGYETVRVVWMTAFRVIR